MGRLVKPERWAWTPALLEPKWRDVARSLVALVPMWDPLGVPVDVAGELSFASATTASPSDRMKPTEYGLGWEINGSGGHRAEWTANLKDPDRDKGAAFLVVTRNIGTATARFWWSLSSTNSCYLERTSSTAVEFNFLGLAGGSWTGFPDLTTQTYQVFLATGGGEYGYRDTLVAGNVGGLIHVATSTYGNDISAPGTPTSLKIGTNTSGAGRLDHYALMWAQWDRAMSEEEARVLVADPFGLIRRSDHRQDVGWYESGGPYVWG